MAIRNKSCSASEYVQHVDLDSHRHLRPVQVSVAASTSSECHDLDTVDESQA